jgi:acyl carrier protein
MKMDEFISLTEEEFTDLKPGILKPESQFREVVEWNSINALILIAMVKTEYDVTIDPEDLVKTKTIQDIYNIIESRTAK